MKFLEKEELKVLAPVRSEINIPTSDQVFDTLDREVLINIEVKTPKDLSVRPKYDS